MTDPVKEQLSACLDGELPEAELDLLLKQVQRDPRLSQSMGRYALLGEVLRTGTSSTVSSGFAARISQAIAAEPGGPATSEITAAPVAPRVAPRWLRPAGGAAIAAGVAALAVMALQPQSEAPRFPGMTGTPMAGVQPGAAAKYTVPTTSTTPSPQLVPATYLAKYALAHSEFAQPLGRRSVWSGMLSDDESEQVDDPVDITTPPDSPPEQP